jgi:hypothetical protein
MWRVTVQLVVALAILVHNHADAGKTDQIDPFEQV